MKTIGIIMIIAGVLLGVYVGVWLLFIGGITQIVNTLKADVKGLEIAYGILKIMFAGLFGTLTGTILIVPGAAVYKNGKE